MVQTAPMDTETRGWAGRLWATLRDPFGVRRRRERMRRRILLRSSEEGVDLRRKVESGIVQDEAGFSARGLGASGGAADVARKRHLAALRAEGRFRIKVETEAYRNEQLLWTEAERRKFFEDFENFFAQRAWWIAKRAQEAWRRRGMQYPDGGLVAIARRAELLHVRLRLEAEEAVAAAEQDIRRERRTRGMYRIAFVSAIITGLGQLVQSAPLVGWYVKGCPVQGAAVVVPATSVASATVVARATATPVESTTVDAWPMPTVDASPSVETLPSVRPTAPDVDASERR